MKDFEDLVRTIVTLVDPEDQDRLREMEDWIIKNEGTWVLSEGFNSFLGRVLHEQVNSLKSGRYEQTHIISNSGSNNHHNASNSNKQ